MAVHYLFFYNVHLTCPSCIQRVTPHCTGPLSVTSRVQQIMMTSSNGNIFRVTGPLYIGEFPAQRPVTRSFDVFFDLYLKRRLSKQSWCWWSETPTRSIWCQCNVTNVQWKPPSTTIYNHTIVKCLYVVQKNMCYTINMEFCNKCEFAFNLCECLIFAKKLSEIVAYVRHYQQQHSL